MPTSANSVATAILNRRRDAWRESREEVSIAGFGAMPEWLPKKLEESVLLLACSRMCIGCRMYGRGDLGVAVWKMTHICSDIHQLAWSSSAGINRMKLIRRGLKKIHFGTNNNRHTLLVSGYVTCCNKFFCTELCNDLSITAMKSYIFARWPCCFLPLTGKELTN
jgi:hypothetical protein